MDFTEDFLIWSKNIDVACLPKLLSSVSVHTRTLLSNRHVKAGKGNDAKIVVDSWLGLIEWSLRA